MNHDPRRFAWRAARLLPGLLPAMLCSIAGVAAAQQTGEVRALEEVVVTAQRRDQALEDVGLSITAIDAEALESLRIDSFESLAGFAPGLQVSPGLGSSNPVFTIRGIGSTIIWSNNNPSIAVHVDEVHHATPAYSSFPLFDIERIEVLKGPQGTLYGRNSTGGAINVITAQPTAQPLFFADVKYGSDDLLEYRQALSGPLASGLNGRLAMYARQGGGYQHSSGNLGTSAGTSPTPGTVPPVPALAARTGYGDFDQLAARATLAWAAASWLDLNLSGHVGRDDSEIPIDRLRTADTVGFEPPAADTDVVFGNRENPSDANQLGAVLRADADIGGLNLSSVTGFESVQRDFIQEDGSPYRITDGEFREDLSSVTQELRLSAGSGEDRLWVLGAYASADDIEFHKAIDITDVLTTIIDTDFSQEDRSWAVFGHSEWRLASAWRLTAGLRHTDERKRYHGGSSDRDPWGVSRASAVSAELADGAIVVDRRYEDAQTTGRVALDYAPRRGALWYAAASTGYKSGGFDGSLITSAATTRPYGAETLRAYEAGTKLQLLDRRLLLTAAAFYYDYRDKQVQATVDLGGGLTEAIIQNAAVSTAHGAELELRWTPLHALQMTFGASWLDTEITGWRSADPEEAAARIGNELPNAAEWTLNAAADWTAPLGHALQLLAHAHVAHTADYFRDVNNNEALAADSVSLLGARLGIERPAAGWRVYVWGENLGDERYRIYSRRPLGSMIADQYGRPRSIGLGASIRYGS